MFDWLAAGDDADTAEVGSALLQPLAAAPEPVGEVDAAQILRERPDVYAAYYREFFGPGNDRHSSAWVDRVGGTSPEDYARYWYKTYGEPSGYTPGEGGLGAPLEEAAPAGRTTIDGIPLSTILADRPDVFRAFFTEYYGAGNDRHSDAWVQRVGGTTPEDYADYWYNAYGKLEGYRPSVAAPTPQAPSDDQAQDPAGSAPLPAEDPSLDPWNHPAIYPDWTPSYPGWEPPGAGATSDGGGMDPPVEPPAEGAAPGLEPESGMEIARLLLVRYDADGGFELVSATLDQMRSFFDDALA